MRPIPALSRLDPADTGPFDTMLAGHMESANDPALPAADEAAMPLDDWLARLRILLPDARDLSLTDAEQRDLLDLARIAAHRSERIAAPLSAFLAGVALADLPPDERAERVAELKSQLARRDISG